MVNGVPRCLAAVLVLGLCATACSDDAPSVASRASSSRPAVDATHPTASPSASSSAATPSAVADPTPSRWADLLPGMPPPLSATDVYAADRPSDIAAVARRAIPMVYVPNGISDTVDEINPTTHRIVRSFRVGRLPQHVVPSYDLRTLWVTNDESNSLTAIDPDTGKVTRTVPVDDPYNMYFTPNGRYAMVMAERLQRIDFRYPQSMKLHHSVRVGCKGVDHGDFTADGRYFIASCEFAGEMVVLDVEREKVVRYIKLGSSNYAPQDVKLAPDGNIFYVADMRANGVWMIDAHTWRVLGRIATGRGAHGLYMSRNDKILYVTNRDEGSIGLIDVATRKLTGKWWIPPSADGRPASPDMGNLDASGRVLWLSGRYSSEVYAINTSTGKLIARVATGTGPHGLCVWPQPGRYSIGHTGIMR